MNNNIGDVLSAAINEAKNNVQEYVWKGPKIDDNQEIKKMVDMQPEELKKCLDHCNEMLYNTDMYKPGRYVLMERIETQKQKCLAELLHRWIKREKHLTTLQCREDIRSLMQANPQILNKDIYNSATMRMILPDIPAEYSRVTISMFMDALNDYLGLCDTQHITLSFITNMGLWFTDNELRDVLLERDEKGKPKNRIELVRRNLNISDKIFLSVNPKTGLSYSEFRAMFQLRKVKYSDLTSEQLEVLASKILDRLSDACKTHAEQWEEFIRQINEVAAWHGWNLKNLD